MAFPAFYMDAHLWAPRPDWAPNLGAVCQAEWVPTGGRRESTGQNVGGACLHYTVSHVTLLSMLYTPERGSYAHHRAQQGSSARAGGYSCKHAHHASSDSRSRNRPARCCMVRTWCWAPALCRACFALVATHLRNHRQPIVPSASRSAARHLRRLNRHLRRARTLSYQVCSLCASIVGVLSNLKRTCDLELLHAACKIHARTRATAYCKHS